MAKIDKEALRELCSEYDKEHGSYPEHEYEGLAIYTFFREKEVGAKYWKDTSLGKEIGDEYKKRDPCLIEEKG